MEAAPQGSSQDAATPPAWRGLSDASLKYLEARGVLLQIEAQEAVHEVARSVISGVIAAVLVLGGWLLVVPALLWMLCKQQGWPFENVFIIAGIFHLLSAIVFLKRMLNRLARARWFAETLDQFKHDRAWLAQQTRNP